MTALFTCEHNTRARALAGSSPSDWRLVEVSRLTASEGRPKRQIARPAPANTTTEPRRTRRVAEPTAGTETGPSRPLQAPTRSRPKIRHRPAARQERRALPKPWSEQDWGMRALPRTCTSGITAKRGRGTSGQRNPPPPRASTTGFSAVRASLRVSSVLLPGRVARVPRTCLRGSPKVRHRGHGAPDFVSAYSMGARGPSVPGEPPFRPVRGPSPAALVQSGLGRPAHQCLSIAVSRQPGARARKRYASPWRPAAGKR